MFPIKGLRRPALMAGVASLLTIAAVSLSPAAEQSVRLPAPATDLPKAASTRSVVLAGGCFWGLQGMYQHVKGVTRVVAGYSGGSASTAHYETVGTGETGHAESVKIEYDPAQVSYGQLLQLFFSTAHNPTELNHQGPDDGTQYRSTIFVNDDSEKSVAQAYMAQLSASGAFSRPIATTLEPMRGFYPAEGYHQDYLIHHPDSMYIVMNDQPKITALHNLYPDLYRASPVLTSPDSRS